jgi:hypothetical protein
VALHLGWIELAEQLWLGAAALCMLTFFLRHVPGIYQAGYEVVRGSTYLAAAARLSDRDCIGTAREFLFEEQLGNC